MTPFNIIIIIIIIIIIYSYYYYIGYARIQNQNSPSSFALWIDHCWILWIHQVIISFNRDSGSNSKRASLKASWEQLSLNVHSVSCCWLEQTEYILVTTLFGCMTSTVHSGLSKVLQRNEVSLLGFELYTPKF